MGVTYFEWREMLRFLSSTSVLPKYWQEDHSFGGIRARILIFQRVGTSKTFKKRPMKMSEGKKARKTCLQMA